MSAQIYRRFIWSAVILVAILIIGTIGYWIIGGRQDSFLDTLYMTVITISTVGFTEIINLSGNPIGRVFTIFIAVTGIGVLAYIVTNLTAFLVEGELTKSFRSRRMEKLASKSSGHYIICGVGRVGMCIVNELSSTSRHYVTVDTDKNSVEKNLESFKDRVFIEGDATDNNVLLKAGIMQAKGLFAVTGDDNHNLVICLTAKQLNSKLRVVTRCNENKNIEKMNRAGADAVVLPNFIGGLRMASEMVRPAAVSFLDTMLRGREENIRVEEISIPDTIVGKAISFLNLRGHANTLLLALKTKGKWIYNPPENHIIAPDTVIIVMTNPNGRQELESFLNTIE